MVPGYTEAERLVAELRGAGFPDEYISVIYPDTTGSYHAGLEHATKAPEGAAAGIAAGGLTGGVVGWLAAMGAIAVPGVAALMAAGPIVAALAGAAVGGAGGSVLGALIGLGVPEIEAKVYEERLHKGNVLVSVHVEDAAQENTAGQIFARHANHISTVSEARAPNPRETSD
jgi:hypothetical protein